MARPRFDATPEQKKNIEAMEAYGIPEEEIARAIGSTASIRRQMAIMGR